MATSNIKAMIPSDLRKVWDFVSDVENYGSKNFCSRFRTQSNKLGRKTVQI